MIIDEGDPMLIQIRNRINTEDNRLNETESKMQYYDEAHIDQNDNDFRNSRLTSGTDLKSGK